jgi:hypothetical protein
MLDTLAIARRIKSRFAKISGTYAAGPLANGRDAYVDLITEGRCYRAYVSMLMGDEPRPVGFDHIMGERPRIDQLVLADLASKHVGAMAKVCQRPEEQAHLEPWHKDGKAGFVVRCAFGARFLVEVAEVLPLQQMEEARAGGLKGMGDRTAAQEA